MGFLRYSLCLHPRYLSITINLYLNYLYLFNINSLHLWNDTIGICELKKELLTKWYAFIAENKTDDIAYISEHYIFNFYKFVI